MSKNKKKKNQQTKVASNLADVKKEQATVEAEANLQQTVVPTEDNLQQTDVAQEAQPEQEADKKGKNKAVEVKAKDVDKKKKKDKTKKPSKVAKALKDTGSELKKVTWPKFGEVVKQTGIVLVVVIVFALVLLGLDKLCSLLVGLLN